MEKKFTELGANGQLFEFRRVPFRVTNLVSCFQRTVDKIIRDVGLKDTFAYVENISVCGKAQAEHYANVIKFCQAAKKCNLKFNGDTTIVSKSCVLLLSYCTEKLT